MKNSNVKNLIGEIQLNYKKHETAEIIKVTSSRDVNDCIRQFFPLEQINHREHMYALYLNMLIR